MMHGHGKLQIAKDEATYFGQFVRGKRQGYGILEFKNMDKYVGQWHEDKPLSQRGSLFASTAQPS